MTSPLVQSAVQDEPSATAQAQLAALTGERDAFRKQLEELKPELDALRASLRAALQSTPPPSPPPPVKETPPAP